MINYLSGHILDSIEGTKILLIDGKVWNKSG